MKTIDSECFYSECPPQRIVGVETEYNIQIPAGASAGNYIAPAAIRKAGQVFMHGRAWNQKFLANGAKLYLDGSHLEYCTPESLGPHQAAAADIAGIEVLTAIVKASGQKHGGVFRVSGTSLRGTDDKVFTNGVHENYMIPTEIAYDPFFEGIMGSHLASRVWATSGDVADNGYRFSQKSSGIGGEVIRFSIADSRRTTGGQKPMVLIPSEADDRDVIGGRGDWSRLEVRFSDPLHSLEGQKTSLGATSLTIRLLEQRSQFKNARFLDVMAKDPMAASKLFMTDLTLAKTVETESGKHMNSLDIGEHLATMALQLTETIELPADEVKTAGDWLHTIDALRRSNPEVGEYDKFLLTRYDVAAKHNYLARKGLLRDDVTAAQGASLFWDRVSPEGIAQKYWRAIYGENEEVSRLKFAAPLTRAALRARYINNHHSDTVPEYIEWSGHAQNFKSRVEFSDSYGAPITGR